MSDANVNHLGQRLGTGATDALWAELFIGEVLTAFDLAVQLKGTVRTRQISGAKSATFPAVYRADAHYHTPGTEINGRNIQANDITVTLDDMLISDVFVAKIEELKNYYDVRAPFAMELGNAQARAYDRTISNMVIAAARDTTELFVGDGHGKVITDQPDIGASADFSASGTDFIAGINLAKQKLEEDLVPVDSMAVQSVVKPASWYLMANADKTLNRLTSSEGNSVNHQVLRTVSDIFIRKSNAPLFGYNVTVYNSATNATGIVSNADPVVVGTSTPAAAALPFGEALPFNYPAKYQNDQTKTVGALWVEPAVAMLELLGLTLEEGWDMRRQGTLILAKSAIGAGKLRVKCAVELKKH